MNVIRVANSLDIEQAARIYRASIQIADWLPVSSRVTHDFASATVGEDIFVAVNSKSGVVGFVSVWTPESFIHHLYVDAAFQRLGIGTELLASLREWLPQPWTLKCVSANRKAIAFYISRGWVAVRSDNGPDGEYQLMRFAEHSDTKAQTTG
jgi:GNAT superfamily N-acetyltransferase